MPGWGALQPIKQFLLEVKRRNPGRSSKRQLALALELISKLKDGNAGYFAANHRRPSSQSAFATGPRLPRA